MVCFLRVPTIVRFGVVVLVSWCVGAHAVAPLWFGGVGVLAVCWWCVAWGVLRHCGVVVRGGGVVVPMYVCVAWGLLPHGVLVCWWLCGLVVGGVWCWWFGVCGVLLGVHPLWFGVLMV